MIQTICTSVIVLGAAAYAVWYVYKHVFVKKDKCEGCAIRKIMLEKQVN
jgi:hypothetical protein